MRFMRGGAMVWVVLLRVLHKKYKVIWVYRIQARGSGCQESIAPWASQTAAYGMFPASGLTNFVAVVR
jgi:hypothetical protein